MSLIKVLLIGIIGAALVLTGCSSKKIEETKGLKVIATNFPCYEFAKAVVGNNGKVTMLLKPGGESHTFAPTPEDMKNIQKADLFIYVGGENDTWADKMLDSFGDKKPAVIKLLNCVPPLKEETTEGMAAEENHDKNSHHEEEIDEHVWTSPRNAVVIAQAIAAKVDALDAKHKASYDENTEKFVRQLEELDKGFRQVVAHAKRKTIIVGDRFPFRYLAKEYGLKYYAAFPGCSDLSQTSGQNMKILADKIKTEKLPVVFHIELSNKKIAQALSEMTHAKIMLLHACHNITAEEFAKGTTYVELQKRNIEALKVALN